MTPSGFPHSEISGSKVVCTSPKLIAACRVLHRLPVPRHPPCALNIFFSTLISKVVSYSILDYRDRDDALVLKPLARFK